MWRRKWQKRERLHPHLPLLHFLPLPTTLTVHQEEEVRKELECEIWEDEKLISAVFAVLSQVSAQERPNNCSLSLSLFLFACFSCLQTPVFTAYIVHAVVFISLSFEIYLNKQKNSGCTGGGLCNRTDWLTGCQRHPSGVTHSREKVPKTPAAPLSSAYGSCTVDRLRCSHTYTCWGRTNSPNAATWWQ